MFMETLLKLTYHGTLSTLVALPLCAVIGRFSKSCSYIIRLIVWVRLCLPVFYISALFPWKLLAESNISIHEILIQELTELSEGNGFYTWLRGNCFWLWLAGFIAFFSVTIISAVIIRNKTREAVWIVQNVYMVDHICTAFIWGIARPRIYLPSNVGTSDSYYMLAHEKCHIQRGDHIIKIVIFIITVVHWFNPFVWLTFYLSTTDMEMSCDELVLERTGTANAAIYSRILLKWSAKNDWNMRGFSEMGAGNVKKRIRHILKYHLPNKSVLIAFLLLGLVFAYVCSAAPNGGYINRKQSSDIEWMYYEGMKVRLLDGLTIEDLDKTFLSTMPAKPSEPDFRTGGDGTLWKKDPLETTWFMER